MECGAQCVQGDIGGTDRTGISGRLGWCADNWGMMDVSFFFRVSNIIKISFAFLPGSISSMLHYPVFLRVYILKAVECRGDEEMLTDCEHRGFSSNICYRRAGVICNSKFYIP